MRQTSTMVLTLLCLLAVPLVVQVAGPAAWYIFDQGIQQCTPAPMGPAEHMAVADKRGEQYTMEDVTERGQVVQTTMRLWDRGDGSWGIIFYRGLARCEQDRRTKRESQEQRREKYR